ncbi:MAG: polysaccharide lyase family 1 protein [Lachnospirales bacterium]
MKRKFISALLTAAFTVSSVFSFGVIANAEDSAISSGVWYESVYMEWSGESGTTYTASIKESSADESGYKSVDSELIREVNPGEYRVDVLGLKADVSYDLLVKNGDNVVGKYTGKPKAFDRSGFAFDDEVDAPGAYKMDGTLEDNTLVIYLTNDNKMNCYEGLSIIKVLGNANKVNNGNPIDIRVIGRIDKPLDHIFQVSVPNVTCGLTIEGVGPNAGFVNWGMNVNYDEDIEFRNLVIRDSGEDAIGCYRTKKLWVHNSTICEGYYEMDDSDERDKLHGDGSCDLRECDKVTISYNHFDGTDKTCLLGSSAKRVEPTGGITFHHNFFDRTGQRTPRVRWHNVHVYNNYYYGTEIYGVAATNNADVFVENNVFEDSATPMIVSAQSPNTDKFSTNDGGAIKSFGNQLINTRDNIEGVDYFEAPTREYRLTAEDFTATKGGWTYNNFDAEGYIGANDYILDATENVKKVVLENAGAQDEDTIVLDNEVYPPYPKGEITNVYTYDPEANGSTGESYGGINGEGTFFSGEGTCKAGDAEVYFIADKKEFSGCFNTTGPITFTVKAPGKLTVVAGAATEVPERATVVNEANPDDVYHGTFQTGYKGGTALSEIYLEAAGTYSFTPTPVMDIYYLQVDEY